MASPSKILNINSQNDYYNLNLQTWKWRCVGLNSPMPNLNKQTYETNVLLTCLYDVAIVNIACKKGKINNELNVIIIIVKCTFSFKGLVNRLSWVIPIVTSALILKIWMDKLQNWFQCQTYSQTVFLTLLNFCQSLNINTLLWVKFCTRNTMLCVFASTPSIENLRNKCITKRATFWLTFWTWHHIALKALCKKRIAWRRQG